MRRHQPRVSNFVAGAVAAIVILAVCYLVFGGGLPFRSAPFTLKATFTVETQLHLGSPVRIAGVNVGSRHRGAARAGAAPPRRWRRCRSSQTACPSTPTRPPTSAPACSWRATSTSTCTPGRRPRPTVSSGATLPASQTTGPGPARSRPVSAALQQPRRPADPAAGSRPVVQRPADRRRRMPPRIPASSGLTAGQALNALAQVRRRRVQGVDDRQRRAAGSASRTTSRAWWPAARTPSPPWPRCRAASRTW